MSEAPEAPVQKQQQALRDKEKNQYEALQRKFAADYALTHGWPRWTRVDAKDIEAENEKQNEKQNENQPRLEVTSEVKRLLPDGVYKKEEQKSMLANISARIFGESTFNIRLQGNTARPIPLIHGKFEQQMSQTMDLLASGRGCRTMVFSGHADLKELQTLIKLAKQKGLGLEFSEEVKKNIIDKLDAKDQNKLYADLMALNTMVNLDKKNVFAGLNQSIKAEETLNEKYKSEIEKDNADVKAKLRSDILKTGAEELKGDQKTQAIQTELAGVEKRIDRLTGACQELSNHLTACEETIKENSTDLAKLSKLGKLREAAGSTRTELLETLLKEQQDLSKRIEAWKLPDNAAATTTKIAELEKKLKDIENVLPNYKNREAAIERDLMQVQAARQRQGGPR